MAESMCRTLRDGSLEGEQAPALTIKDTTASPFGFHSPSFYVDLLKRRGIDVKSYHKCFQILDCYSDPLDWKDQHMTSGNFTDVSYEASLSLNCVCKNVKDLDKLYSLILELGKGLVGQGKKCFSVAIDSINEMLRHTSTSTVAGLLSNLRSHGISISALSRLSLIIEQISSGFWLLHPDLHEVKVTSILEYLSSVVASVEPLHLTANGQRRDLGNLSLLEQNFGKGKLQVRLSAKMGVFSEGFHIDQSGINFTSALSEDELFKLINQGHLPKVQFNLDLSEEERIGRDKVVLPFEHQGVEMVSLFKSTTTEDLFPRAKLRRPLVQLGIHKRLNTGEGEIIYFRDSDDEMPYSDEDPDDDLDI